MLKFGHEFGLNMMITETNWTRWWLGFDQQDLLIMVVTRFNSCEAKNDSGLSGRVYEFGLFTCGCTNDEG